nr:lipopolysaccharide biosynthesis protein [Providencia stuartii]
MLILGRILGPESVGLIGMLAVFIALAQVFVDSGFSNALIRKQDRTQLDLSTAYYFNISVAIVCYLILFLAAPYIALFYQQPLLIDLTRVLGLVVIINGFSIIQRVKLTCDMNFKILAKCSLIAVLASTAIALLLAYQGHGPWALIGQSITFSLVNTILLNFNHKWLPSLAFSKKSFNYLFSFGSKLLLSGLIDTLYNNIYQIVIGKVFNPKQVGIFTQANTLSYIPASSLTSIIQRVTYPMLSKIQDDTNKLNSIYKITLQLSACVIFPIIMGIAIIAKPLVILILGDTWSEASVLLSILCIGYMLYPIHSINLNLLQVKARTDLFLKLELIKKLIITLILLITIPFGIKAICIGIIIQSYLALYLNTYYTKKIIGLTCYQQFQAVFPIWLITMIIFSLSWQLSQMANNLIMQLVMSIIITPILYIFAIRYLQPKVFKFILSTIFKKNIR